MSLRSAFVIGGTRRRRLKSRLLVAELLAEDEHPSIPWWRSDCMMSLLKIAGREEKSSAGGLWQRQRSWWRRCIPTSLLSSTQNTGSNGFASDLTYHLGERRMLRKRHRRHSPTPLLAFTDVSMTCARVVFSRNNARARNNAQVLNNARVLDGYYRFRPGPYYGLLR